VIELYPFQDRLVSDLRRAIRTGFRAPLLVSPTGSGKTVMFAFLVSRMAMRGVRCVILAHRQELLAQISRTLDHFDAPHGMIEAGTRHDPGHMTYVGSVFTAARRLKKIYPPDYVIVDEAHHAINGSTWNKCIDFWRHYQPDLKVIGVTATPIRLSGEGLNQTFDHLVMGPTPAELIAKGFLCNYTLFRTGTVDTRTLHMRGGDYKRDEVADLMGKPSITGDAIAHYRKHLDGKPSIAFCVSVEHAQSVAESFRAAGYRAASIDGKMDKRERKRIIQEFTWGRINVLVSCDLISEGFDVPAAYGGILLRPTESEGLYLQQVGRLLRTHQGKERAVILDHAGNSFRHGLPDEPREWSLEGSDKRKARRDPDDVQVRQCQFCGACSSLSAVICRECGQEFPVKPRMVKEVDGELQEVDPSTVVPFKRQQGMAADFDALVALGKMRGMKNPHGWANHVMRARQQKRNRMKA
jgi:DNA repair protein RadD